MSAITIGIVNQKGGVAKSTTAVNLSSALQLQKKKILLVDADAQSNSTNNLGINDETLKTSLYDLLKDVKITEEQIKNTIIKTQYNIDLLPSDISLAEADQTLITAINRELLLDKILTKIKNYYDFIIIDSPPSLSLIALNILSASDYIIIPLSAGFFSVKGISRLLDTISSIKESIKENLEIMGVLLTKYDSRKNITKTTHDLLNQAFKDKILKTTIRINAEIEYAQDAQQPIFSYNDKCNGAIDYINLAKEILKYVKNNSK